MNLPLGVALFLIVLGTICVGWGVWYGSKPDKPKITFFDPSDYERQVERQDRVIFGLWGQLVGALIFNMTPDADHWYMHYFWGALTAFNIICTYPSVRRQVRYWSYRIDERQVEHEEFKAEMDRIFVDVYGGLAVVPRGIRDSVPW